MTNTYGSLNMDFKVPKFIADNYGPEPIETMPPVSSNLLMFALTVRKNVEAHERDFRLGPHWIEVYNDTVKNKMIKNARQTWKSTFGCDELLCDTTSEEGVYDCYVSHDDTSVGQFSNTKLRDGAINNNPIMKMFPERGSGAVGEISMKNRSHIFLVNDNYEYKHVEGLSLKRLVIDEAQYQDLEFLPKAEFALTSTKGGKTILGIGGEKGSPYEHMWNQTDQRRWKYTKYQGNYAGFENMEYRKHLEFNSEGLVVDDYLWDLQIGEWQIQNIQGEKNFHGYWMPQTLFPAIPLTIDDCLNKYKLESPRFSIEWQQKNTSETYFQAHIMGGFYKAARRPVTREMVMRCMDSRYSLMNVQEIAAIKEEFGNKVRIGLGVDWGSSKNNTGKTVICIIIFWRETGLYQIAYLDQRSVENQLMQAELVSKIYRQAKCDIGVADLGYGHMQVKMIQDGGFLHDTGEPYEACRNFYGCKSTGADHYRGPQFAEEVQDEHGDTVSRFTIDKTSSIDEIIADLETFVTDPDPNNKIKSRTKILIPHSIDYETDFLIDDFTSITRTDLNKIVGVVSEDTRQIAKKKYGHPPDSVMSIIYAKTAVEHNTDWNWVSA